MFCTYQDYLQRWDDIAAIFSRDAVWRGSFDRYADSARAKRGTAEVDAAFLKEIESWRELLVRNLALCQAPGGEWRLTTALGANIKCGNSLIGPDFSGGSQLSLFDEETQYRNPKIVYPDLCSAPRFGLNEDGMYPNNTVFCNP